MIAICIANKITDVNGVYPLSSYDESVKPLNYEFDLVPQEKYLVLGFKSMNGNPWIYYAKAYGDIQAEVAPLILFNFQMTLFLSQNFIATKPNGDGFEMVPPQLSEIENWFEKYCCSENRSVIKVVDELVENLRVEYFSKLNS
ncbi:hypothetical protein [Stenotrophomonas maltophilia]|uniref:hypothetical protein n=1 Tax=Stenotrophomonas maltophilia TaxID=40324 RepID=UPI003BF787A4